jgi:uncharacterized protein
MTFDDVIRRLSHAPTFPEAALRAAMEHAEAVAERIAPLAQRAAAGHWLTAGETSLLLFGVHVVAAARVDTFWPVWKELCTQRGAIHEDVFGFDMPFCAVAMALSLGASRTDELAELVTRSDIGDQARGGIIQALCRLACEGRFPRDHLIALIDQLATGAHQDQWMAAHAIIDAGIGERRELAELLWDGPAFANDRPRDRDDDREQLARNVADPANMDRFDEVWAAAPEDPVRMLNWLQRRMSQFPQPKGAEALDADQVQVLEDLFASAEPAGMSFEAFDGFLHALVIGPDMVMPSQFLPEVWGEGPVFDDRAQAERATQLIMRHWNNIAAATRGDGYPELWLIRHADKPIGQDWGRGFARGVALRQASWLRLWTVMDEAIELLKLAGDDLNEDEREEIVWFAGSTLREIAAFWMAQQTPRRPVKAAKVGRNDPCPCGSGKKWKKCCSAASGALH